METSIFLFFNLESIQEDKIVILYKTQVTFMYNYTRNPCSIFVYNLHPTV